MSDKEAPLVDTVESGHEKPVTWGMFVGAQFTAAAILWTIFTVQMGFLERGIGSKIDAHMGDVNNTDAQLGDRIKATAEHNKGMYGHLHSRVIGMEDRLNSWYESTDRGKTEKPDG